jgi:hypothetical protein
MELMVVLKDIFQMQGFLSSKDSHDQKLEKAKAWLTHIKENHGEIEI